MNKIIKSAMFAAAMFVSLAANALSLSLSPDVIDFLITSDNGGALTWDTGSDRLVGSGINIATVESQTLPGLTDVVGPFPCPACVLTFATGTHTTGGDFGGGLDGSAIVITAGGTPIMAGKFTDGYVISTKAGIFNILGAGFIDFKVPEFAALMGFSPDITSWTGALNLQFASTAGFKPGVRFSGMSGDVTNMPASPPSEVPVPAASWLFGSGLLGLVQIARRKAAVESEVSM